MAASMFDGVEGDTRVWGGLFHILVV